MADSSAPGQLPRSSDDDLLELNKDLERMTEDVENMSVQLTWMAYDMVALRTGPELGASMRKLEEAYRKCRAAVCGDPDQESQMDRSAEAAVTTLTQIFQMENTKEGEDEATSNACIDLANIIRELDCFSSSMDQLALRTHQRQCDLIVCIGHPDKLALLKIQEAVKQQSPEV